MRYLAWIALAGAVAPWFAPHALAADCPDKGRPIELAAKSRAAGGKQPARIGVFSSTGKFIEEVDASAVDAGATVLDCNETYGLVLIRIGGQPRWVDRLEVRIRRVDEMPCLVDTNRQRPDHTEPVSSGVGEPCKPAAAQPPGK